MTELDSLVDLVNEQSEVTIDQVVKSIGVEEKDVLEMAKILQEHDILKIHYTVIGDIILKKGKKLESEEGVVKEVIQKIEESNEESDIDRFLDSIRKEIFEKKYGKVENEKAT